MPTELTLLVERLRESPLVLEVDALPEELDLQDPEYRFPSPVRGELRFRLVGQDVLGTGELRARIEADCVRCLQPAGLDLRVDVNEVWMKPDPHRAEDTEFMDEKEFVHTYDGIHVELRDVLRELIMAELPEKPLCREDCRGLCPRCGADLNREACRCPAEGSDSSTGDPALPDWKRKLKNLKLDE